MSLFNNAIIGASGQQGYKISRSVRLRSSASAYLNRTPASATNRKTWTWSGWVKIGKAASTGLFTASTSGSNMYTIQLGVGGELNVYAYTGSYPYFRYTSAVFRDYSAWYHFVVAFDSTQATDTNRIKIYVNGVLQSTVSGSGSGWPTLNYDGGVNNTINHQFSDNVGGASYFDGYLTEINFIDGQALTPSSFGETNAVTGVWQPKKYAGTYGTNGFYLNFSDNSGATATTIGKDYSGNGNNWTPNNISVTAGTTYDSMLDVPTPYADGGNGRGNYAVLSPLANPTSATLSNANLSATLSASGGACGTIAGFTSGQWYYEATITSGATNSTWIGWLSDAYTKNDNSWSYSTQVALYNNLTGNNGNNAAYGATYSTNDVIGVAIDLSTSNGSITFYKNGVSQGVMFSALTTSAVWRPMFSGGSGGQTVAFNFGQRPFSYTPPTGFVALNTQNLPAPTISNGANYMAATTYTGTGSALTIANTVGSASFQPDLVWVKGRSGATDHALYDAVRGVQKQLESNTTTAETTETTGLTAFGSTGFTVGALAQMNTNTATYVGWQWNAGGSTVTNTSGSISSQVRANATAGFSVVTYTGNGTAGATVGHGLGVAPSMIIVKRRSTTGYWPVYHISVGNNQGCFLNLTNAVNSQPNLWNSTTPSSTVFTVGTDNETNQSTQTLVAYCFAPVAGYSAFGRYTGNGSADGPFVYLGFRPRFVMYKRTDTTGSWVIIDSTRGTYNVINPYLLAESSGAEDSSVAILDFLSNGFKQRNTFPASNGSGGTYIYMAFAENPLKLSLAR